MKVYPPSAKHTHTAILLHGRDSGAAEFAAELFESQASDERTLREIFPNIKWVFPTAGMLSSARFGCAMSQWFDMRSTEDPHEQEEAQDMAKSVRRIQDLVADEAALVGGAGHVFLGGISQGGAVAVLALLGGHVRLAGFIGWCSWMPCAHTVSAREMSSAAIETPVLLCHSRDDEVIDPRFGQELRDTLESVGMAVQWREYAAGGHWVNEPEGVDDMVAFMRTIEFAEQQ